MPLALGILLVGGVTLVYSTVGGLWADALTDFGQFVIQLVAGVAMFVLTAAKLGTVFGIWDQLPPSHAAPFAGDYTLPFFLGYAIISTISYNGGTWNLAQRFIASPNGSAARKSILLSGALYLIWPLVLFFPMWAAPILLPNLAEAGPVVRAPRHHPAARRARRPGPRRHVLPHHGDDLVRRQRDLLGRRA